MAYTIENNYTGNGSTRIYSFTFPYLEDTDVKVSLNQVDTTNFEFANATQINFTADASGETSTQAASGAPKSAITVRIYRDTNIDNLQGEFFSGSAIRAQDLNNDFNQTLYVSQETQDKVDGHWNDTTDTIDSTEAFADVNTKIMTAAAIDDRINANIAAPALANGKIWAGNGSGVGAQVTPSGDVTMANTGAFTIASGSVETAMIAADAVDGTKIADDVINSEHLAAGSIDLEHMSANSVDSAQYVDGSIDTAHIANDAVNGTKIADDAIGNEHIAATAVQSTQLADNSVVSGKINADAVQTDKIADLHVTTAKLANDAVTIAKIADDAVGADQLASNAVVNASVASGAAIEHAKLAAVTSGNVIVGNGSNQAASVAMSGDVAIAAGGATTIQANAVEIGMIGCEQTTISDSDSHIPTSGAVVDYVAAAIAPIGGLEVIADDESFPNTIPNAGVVISITDCAGLSVNSSGVSTNGDALDNSTITINGFPSELRGGVGSNADPYVFASGAGLMVQSTGSSQTYNYHQALIREADFVNLSDDINDFNNRYRIASSAPGSDNDEGDLYFNTSTNKMNVYDGSAWGEVTSTGDYKLLGIKDNGQAYGGSLTFNGSNDQFDLFDGSSDASITSAGQLLVSLNGVLQKPNASYDASGEGFALDGSDGIRFCDPPPSGSVCFVTQIGTATTINVPADNSVTSAKIQDGAVATADLAADAVDGTKLADNACDSEHYTDGSIDLAHMSANSIDSDQYVDGSIDHVHLAADCVDGDNIQDDVINSEHIAAGAVDLEHMSSQSVDEDNLHISNSPTNGYFLSAQSGNAGGLTWAEVGGGVSSDAQNNTLAGDAAGDSFTGTDAVGNSCFGENAGTAITTGDYNHCFGFESGKAITTGNYNIAVGFESLKTSTTGSSNIAIGHKAINGADVTGASNIAIGTEALKGATGNFNGQIGIGYRAGYQTTSDGGMTAIGFESCMSNTTGIRNTGIGYKTLRLATGGMNTALGYLAGVSIGGASNNTMIGHEAGQATNIGASNTVVGYNAAYLNTEGNENVAVGNTAMYQFTTGDENTAVGGRAMYGSGSSNEAHNNVCVGYESGEDITTGSYNTFIGSKAAHEATTALNNVAVGINAGGTLTTGATNVFIGHEAGMSQVDSTDSGLYIARSTAGPGNAACWIHGNANGQMYNGTNSSSWNTSSDRRIKKNIEDNTKGLTEINQLRVANFEYRTQSEINMNEFPLAKSAAQVVVGEGNTGVHTGVIAQEIESVLPECVVSGARGVKTVSTDPILWALVNAVKELSAEVKTLKEAK